MVFNEDGKFLRRIGCENLTNFPNGIDISDAGDVLIGDSHGNRFHVAVFSRDGSLISEFECPYVKVRHFIKCSSFYTLHLTRIRLPVIIYHCTGQSSIKLFDKYLYLYFIFTYVRTHIGPSLDRKCFFH